MALTATEVSLIARRIRTGRIHLYGERPTYPPQNHLPSGIEYIEVYPRGNVEELEVIAHTPVESRSYVKTQKDTPVRDQSPLLIELEVWEEITNA